jgi:hypothetical protein
VSDIFVSYHNKDEERVLPLISLLEERWSVWWDREIPAGKSFPDVIEKVLYTVKCVVVVWSEKSVESDWVRTEAAVGAERKILVPVLIDEVKIPFEFKRIQAIRLINWPDERDEAAIIRLQKSVALTVSETPAQNQDEKESPDSSPGKEPIRDGATPSQELNSSDKAYGRRRSTPAPGLGPWVGLVALLTIILAAFLIYKAMRPERPAQPENRNQPPAGNYQFAPGSNDSSTTVNSNRGGELPAAVNRRFPAVSNQTNSPQANAATPLTAARGTGDLSSELRDKGLMQKLTMARAYAAAGSSSNKEKALNLYRQVVGQLSPRARGQLDQSLLSGAERDYKGGNMDEAIIKYRSLFDSYF